MQTTLAEEVVKLLKDANMTVTTVESCTGGLISAALVDVSGASAVLNQAYVTYANEAKQSLAGVKAETLEAFGAVSEQTAREMAEGGAKAAKAEAALAVTGIAGPDGGTAEKPVGLVYIGCYVNEKTVVKEFRFNGNRNKVRELTVVHALDLLRRTIIENYE